jgi:hypothetical protein
MDPAVASERKWDWGRIYYNLEGYSIYLLTPWLEKWRSSMGLLISYDLRSWKWENREDLGARR